MSVMLGAGDVDRLLSLLADEGYETLGPVVKDDAISYGPVSSASDLPYGLVDEQGPGRFRLIESDAPPAFFDALPGQASWKEVVIPARETLWEATSTDGRWEFRPTHPEDRLLALIGVRACELAAFAVLDRIFIGGTGMDPRYGMRRDNLFVVAVECGRAAPTCFCTSMETGPRVDPGHGADLVLTELPGTGFIARGDAERGFDILTRLQPRSATVEELEAGIQRTIETAESITRHLDLEGLREGIASAAGTAVWGDLEERCMACGNCTLACPTCFCSSAEDVSDLDGTEARRDRVWASCFSLDYSYMYGHTVRNGVGTRYRHWITHKLSTWVDQFGSYGCVGCGRCITWCPVGIDIVEEASRIVKREFTNA
ncbi:MAG: 4Fe-4S dicluster domain-containing protein [Acidimicrobiia bacterium]|nr:4Fe-4S dicluster domain-containing protein [Acidimicrobiia bacterium]